MTAETNSLANNVLTFANTMWMDNHVVIVPEVIMSEDKEKNSYPPTLNTSIILQPLDLYANVKETFDKSAKPSSLDHTQPKSADESTQTIRHLSSPTAAAIATTLAKNEETPQTTFDIHDIRLESRTVICTWCKIEFNDKNKLLDHIKQNHRVDRVHRCLECSKVFTQKSNLKAHYRLHTGERPFKCDYCTKTFAQKSNLVNHLSVHTQMKPYECPICQRAFSQRSNLKSHIYTHTGEKPYKCHLCTKDFIQKSNLVSHVRTHTAEKPHRCDVCDKYFSQRSNLLSHMRLHSRN